MSSGPFSRRTLWIIAGVAVASLTAIILMAVVGPKKNEVSAGSDSYSRSALGYHGLVEKLRGAGVPVLISQNASGAKAGHGVLVIAEPIVSDEASKQRLRELVQSADNVLLVLPKWYGIADPARPEWVADVGLLPEQEITDTLAAATDNDHASLVRTAAPGPLHVADAVDHGQGTPELAAMPQLYLGDGEIEVHADESSLLVRITTGGDDRWGSGDAPTHNLWILSDPDVLNNYGLGHGDNWSFARALFDRMRGDGPVVFDEVVHGYKRETSLLHMMFQYPFVLGTIQGLICLVLVLAATTGRFGPPARVAPPLAAGKDFLIRNTAALLRSGGHDAAALRRYFAVAVADVRATLHAPRELTGDRLTRWLEQIRASRRGTVALPELEREVDGAGKADGKRLIELARRIHLWRTEMTQGVA